MRLGKGRLRIIYLLRCVFVSVYEKERSRLYFGQKDLKIKLRMGEGLYIIIVGRVLLNTYIQREERQRDIELEIEVGRDIERERQVEVEIEEKEIERQIGLKIELEREMQREVEIQIKRDEGRRGRGKRKIILENFFCLDKLVLLVVQWEQRLDFFREFFQ